MCRFKTVFLIAVAFVISLLPVCSHGAQVLELTDHQEKYRLFNYLGFVEDTQENLTIEQVASPENQGWFKTRKAHFGFSGSVFWARLKVVNHSRYNQWFAVLNNVGMHTLDRIDFFQPLPGGGYDMFRDGEEVEPDKKMIPSISLPAFGFYIAPGQSKTFYFRIQDEGLIALPLILRSQKEMESFSAARIYWLFVFGAFGFFLVYNLLLYATLRDMVFLYFSLMLSSYLLLFFVPQMMFSVFPGLDTWVINRLKDCTMLFYYIAWLLLTKNYFRLNKLPGLLGKWVNCLLIITGITGAALFLLPYGWALPFSVTIAVINCLSIFMISVCAWRKGFAAGRYYVIAVTFIFLPSALRGMNTLGFLNVYPYLRIMDNMGSFLVILLFSCLALIDRHNILNKQVLAAHKKAELAKDEFLANTSHELRTPLHGIIGLCEDLLTRGKNASSQEREQELNIVIQSARRLSSLVDDILDFTRIRQGSVRLQKRAVDFGSALKLAVSLCRPLIGKKPVRIRTDIPETLMPVLADENRLQQILLNLIKNAIKFTSEGEILISAQEKGAVLKVSIQDTGGGIPESKMPQVFERFFQADGTIGREHGGVGLGLAITRQLIELHGGQISVSNNKLGGANFEFTIGFAKKGSEADLTPSLLDENLRVENNNEFLPVPVPEFSIIQSERNTFEILIVDDELISLHTLHNHLKTAGFNVRGASGALEARNLLNDVSFDLVILDIMMPGINGYELCREIRETYNPTELPVIMLTARTQTKDLIHGFECGANDYLTKPVNREELLARIQISLKLKALADLLRENKDLKEEIMRRKRAEHSLEDMNRRLAAMLNLWESALMLVDMEGRVIYANDYAGKMVGYQPHLMVNQSVQNFFEGAKDCVEETGRRTSFEEFDGDIDKSSCHQLMIQQSGDKKVNLEVIITPVFLNNQAVFAWICREKPEIRDEMPKLQQDRQMMNSLARHRQKIQTLQGAFDSALKYLGREGGQLRDELMKIDNSMADTLRRLPPEDQEHYYRKTIVALMTSALACWTEVTGLDKVALAEKSGIWKTYLDVSTFKTRTLDKYLNLEKLPKNPRWKDVLKTADFVIRECNGDDHPSLNALDTSLAEFKTVLSVRN